MDPIRTFTIKAFTKDPKRGNPAVVIDAPVDSKEALRLTKEALYPVAVLIDTRQKLIPIRFFYEHGRTEVFACGHATLAAAHIAFPSKEGPREEKFVNHQGAIIDIICFPDGKISQTQTIPEFKEVHISRDEVAKTLHIPQVLDELPVQLVGPRGKMKLMIPVSLEDLLKIERDFEAIQVFCTRYSTDADPITGLFPFALGMEGLDAHARHFPNRDEEDLVCGIGSVALAEYLQRYLRPNQQNFSIRCGPGAEGRGDVVVRMERSEGTQKLYLEGYALVVETDS